MSGRISILASRTAAYYAMFVVLGLSTSSLGPTLLGLAAQTRSAVGEISVLFSARACGYLFGSFAGGHMFDRLPAHRTLALALIAAALLLSTIPFISLVWLLVPVMLLLGLLEGVVDVGGNTLIVWLHRDRVASFMNGLHLFWAVGAFLSPIFVAQALRLSGGIAWSYWSIAVLLLPVALRLLPMSNPLPLVPHEERANVRPPKSLLLLTFVFFLLVGGGETSFGGWIYTYAVKSGMSDDTSAAYLNAAFWGAFILARALSIPIAALASSRTIILVDLWLSIAALALLLAIPASPLMLWVGVILFGTGVASVFPAMLNFAGRQMVVTGSLTGWCFAGSSTGGMIIPWIIGQGFEWAGPQIIPLLIFATLVGGLGVFLSYRKS